MKKKNILIDLDSTVFRTHDVIYDKIYEKLGIKINPLDSREYDLAKAYNLDDTVVWDLVKEVINMDTLPEEPDASKVLKFLCEEYNIHFVSHRPDKTYEATISQINNLGIPNKYKLQLVNDNHYECKKHIYAIHYDIKIIIEDKTSTILDCAKFTDASILVYNQPWNIDIFNTYNIRRVFSWWTIEDLLYGHITYNKRLEQ